MSLVEKLMDSAIVDTDVLRRLNSNGDRFEVFRDVDFVFVTKSHDKSRVIRDFINDHCFGIAAIEENPFEVLVKINMPVTQSVLLCVSGFMNCIAELYDVELDGWGCNAQTDT